MPSPSPFVVHSSGFRAMLGEFPTLELLVENEAYPFAHEAGYPALSGGQRVQLTKVHLGNGTSTSSGPGTGVECEELTVPIPMANGGVNYKDGILFCAQGSIDASSGLNYMSSIPPYTTAVKADFHGRPFNSVNHVVVHTDGSIWFTDPIYGHEQGYRPPPRLPNQVYRFDPETGSIRAMVDGFGRPNGICFSPDEQVVYVTDTDQVS